MIDHRIEEGDDEDGNDVVDDGERKHEDLRGPESLRPRSAITPPTSAMSVAIGMAQPAYHRPS